MKRLLTFLVILGCLMALMDRVHIPPNIAEADTKKSAPATQETSQKPDAPKIQAATYESPPPPKYTRTGGCEQYRQIMNKYDWDVRVMMAVMEAESYNAPAKISCDSQVEGDTWPIAGVLAHSCGLLQVRTIAEWRGTCEQLKDPEFNIDIAYKIYKGQGLTAWSVYSNGKYLKYL